MAHGFRVVRLDPKGGIHSVVATFARREAAEQCAEALTRTLLEENYGVVAVNWPEPAE